MNKARLLKRSRFFYLSRYVFSFLPSHGGYEVAGKMHVLCAYWGFVLMSLHLGIHWRILLSIVRRYLKPSNSRRWISRIVAYLFAGYGIIAFVRRDVGTYLLLKSHFVFFDYSEPVIFFLIDYLAIMGLFVLIGFYFFRAIGDRASSPKGPH